MNLHLSKTQSPLKEMEAMSYVPYQQAIGSLIYVMVCICPDLMFTMEVDS